VDVGATGWVLAARYKAEALEPMHWLVGVNSSRSRGLPSGRKSTYLSAMAFNRSVVHVIVEIITTLFDVPAWIID